MRLVFDLEADGWRDQATKVWCIVIQDLDSDYTASCSWKNNANPDMMHHIILDKMSKADELIGHNIIDYDLPLLERLYAWTPSPKTKITDTVIYSRLLKSDRRLPDGCLGSVKPHSLNAWGYRVGRGKPDHDDWTKFSPEMLHRCREDVAINVLVYHALIKEARESGLDWTQSLEIEHAIARIIVRQELNGVPLDLPRIWSTRLQLVDRMVEINKDVVPKIPPRALPTSKQGTWPTKQYKKDGTPTVHALKYYGPEFGKEKEYRTDRIVKTAPINLKSDKQVKEYLLSIGWVPTEWNFKKDKSGKPLRDPQGNKIRTSPKLKLESLESCHWPEDSQEMGGKLVEYLMLAHREGMLRGWLRDVRPDGRISAQALPCGTPTGRMTHRQVVNVPRNSSLYGQELRSCFTSVPGYTRVGIDLASCQLRALCHEMKDEEFQRQVVEGKPHDYSAEMAGLVADNKMSAKDKGKKLNYTVLFGGGDEKVSTDLGMSVQEAKRVRATFFRNLPALPALLKRLKREWKAKGYLVGLDGRAVWVRAEHMLLVYLMQSIESIIMKEFIIEVMMRVHVRTAGHPQDHVQLVTTMHDEVQFLIKDSYVEGFKRQAQRAIEYVNEKYNLVCPQAIDINVGTTWAECH